MKSTLVILKAIGILFASFFLAACNTASPASQESAKAPQNTSQTAAREITDVWQSVIAGSKREGRIVIYSSGGPQMRDAMAKPLKEKFGLDLEYVAAPSSELVTRVMNENRAGLHLVDIAMGGGNTVIGLSTRDMLLPVETQLVLPEITSPENIKNTFYTGEFHYIDAKKKYVIATLAYPSFYMAINKEYLKLEDIGSYADLLNPKFKGKISIIDPTIPGNGQFQIFTMGAKLMNWEFIRSLAGQEPAVMRDSRLQMDWAAQGKYPIAIGGKPEIFQDFVNNGVPLAIPFLKEGTYLSAGSGNFGVVTNTPHPQAAKAFINWILTREGQTILSQSYGGQSVRLDVPSEGLKPGLFRLPGFKYPGFGDDEEFQLQRLDQAQTIKDIFDPLIRK